MKATLDVDRERTFYPEGIHHLEGLLLFVMDPDGDEKKIVTEVKIDGTLYSEKYPHQAREVALDRVEKIEIHTQTEQVFAEECLRLSPAYMDTLEEGFKAAASLLKIPMKETEGLQLLGLSVEALRSFKTHFENVEDFLQRRDAGKGQQSFWPRFETLIDQILISQEQKEAHRIADLLEDRLIPFLESWKDRLGGSERS